jgi:hypothetical protein
VSLSPNSLPNSRTILASLRRAREALDEASREAQRCDDGSWMGCNLADLVGGLSQAVSSIAYHLEEDTEQ